jgi:hypothetical protein
VPLKVLAGTFVGLGLFHGRECSQVASLAGLGILFSGVEAVFTGLEFTDHTKNWMTTEPGMWPFTVARACFSVRFRTHFPINGQPSIRF